jgi:exopolysaccharide biosynthesis predicted pyruvyltransferase EpsI
LVIFFEPSIKVHHYNKEKKFPITALCIANDTDIYLSDDLLNEIDLFFSFHTDDNILTQRLSLLKDNRNTTNEWFADSHRRMYSLLNNVDLLITSRFHAGVLATLNQHTKVVSLVKSNDHRWYKFKCEFNEQIDVNNFLNDPVSYTNKISLKKETAGQYEIKKIPFYKKLLFELLSDYFMTFL